MEILSDRRRQLIKLSAEVIRVREASLIRLRGMLGALGPESAFQRGFSITLDPQGRIIRSAAALNAGDVMRTRFADGEVASRVE